MTLKSMRRAAVALLGAASMLNATHSGASELPVVRPVISSYSIEAGSAHRTDTYLSPLKYSGWSTSLSYRRSQAMRFDPANWVMQLHLKLMLDRTHNSRANSVMNGLSLRGSWGMVRRWSLPYGFSAGLGGSTTLSVGGLLNSRNGNNPASAMASWTIDLTGYAAWNGSVLNLPVTLRYQPVLPLGGVFFAPDYGELYYEIWLGNHSGLVHPAWWGNWFRLDNLLTADLHFGSTSLRVGYAAEINTWRVNNLTSRTFTHSLVLGITTEWISLRPQKTISPKARIISANY